MPLVSIIVPVYNVENYIEKCLESVRNQSYTKFECLIVNDGSKDRSIEIAKKFETEDNRFSILHKENGGLSSARNFGMLNAKGEYISFLDADDFWTKEKLLNQLDAFLNDKSIGLVYSNVTMLSEKDNLNFNYKGEHYQKNPLELLCANKIIGSGSSVTISKSILKNVGMFDERLKSFEDLEFWFRCAVNNVNFHFIKSKDVFILKRNTSLSTNKNKMMYFNILSFKIQLNELKKHSFPISDIFTMGKQRIIKSKKYFNPKASLDNYWNLFKLYFILFKSLFTLKFNSSSK